MLQSVNLKNFQPYIDETIEVGPGVNVITGQSNSGKSAIVRGISWGVQNVPRGDSFHCHHAKNGDTSVTLTFDDGVVSRVRSGSRNDYIVNGENVYTALRTGVPDEVFEVTRMEDLNVQKQHESYFLFQHTSGQVATRINSIVGLEIMDKVLSTINQIVTETKKEVVESEQKEAEINASLKKLDWVDEAETIISDIESWTVKLSELESHCQSSSLLVKQARTLENEKKRHDEFLSIERTYIELVKEVADLNSFNESNIYLKDNVFKAKRFQRDRQMYDTFISIEPIHKKLTDDATVLIQTDKTNSTIRADITKAKRCQSEKSLCDSFLSITPSFDSLVILAGTLNSIETNNQKIRESTNKARILRREVQSVRRTLKICEPIVKDLESLHTKFADLMHTTNILKPLIAPARKYQKQVSTINDELSECENVYHKILGESEQCPICGQTIQKKLSN